MNGDEWKCPLAFYLFTSELFVNLRNCDVFELGAQREKKTWIKLFKPPTL